VILIQRASEFWDRKMIKCNIYKLVVISKDKNQNYKAVGRSMLYKLENKGRKYHTYTQKKKKTHETTRSSADRSNRSGVTDI
jgi:hypothetical protein